MKLFLKSLNNPIIESINLSYIPKITHITPLLTPGSMAPAPNNIPIKNLVINNNHSNLFYNRYDRFYFLLQESYYKKEVK